MSALILDVRLGLSKLTSQLELDEIAGVFCLHVTLLARINGKALFLGIQVLLNAVGIFLCPFIGLAVSHEVIVGKVGRAVGVVVLLAVGRVVGVGDCHDLVGQAKVQMALVQVSVPVVAGVVPG